VIPLFLSNQLFLPPRLLLYCFSSLAHHLQSVQLAQVAILNDLVDIRQQILLPAQAILLLLLPFDALFLQIVYRLFVVMAFV
jgi:hypothetical protein